MSRQGGFGAVLKIDVSLTLTAVVNVEEFEWPEFEKILAEVTAHDSPDGYAEHIASGKRQLNEFSCTLTWDISADTHEAIQAAFDADDPVDMSVEDPGGTEVIAFSGHVKNLGRITEQDGAYRCEVAIQPTGQPVINGS